MYYEMMRKRRNGRNEEFRENNKASLLVYIKFIIYVLSNGLGNFSTRNETFIL